MPHCAQVSVLLQPGKPKTNEVPTNTTKHSVVKKEVPSNTAKYSAAVKTEFRSNTTKHSDPANKNVRYKDENIGR